MKYLISAQSNLARSTKSEELGSDLRNICLMEWFYIKDDWLFPNYIFQKYISNAPFWERFFNSPRQKSTISERGGKGAHTKKRKAMNVKIAY